MSLSEHASRALRAQLQLRPSTPDAPLLPLTDRALALALSDAAVDLGIHVHGRRAERHQHPRRWLARLGLTLTTLK